MNNNFRLNNEVLTNFGLLTARVLFSGLLIINHGLPKLWRLSGDEVKFMQFMGLSPWLSMLLAVIGEVFFPILIILGVQARISALPPLFVMLIAISTLFTGNLLKDNELALLFFCGFLVLLISGGGKYTVVNLFKSLKKKI